MRKAGFGISLAWFFFSAAVLVFAQGKDKDASSHHYGKAGLWEVTSSMTWQKAPALHAGAPGGPPAAGSHTTEVCLTQQMVDAGALFPQSRGQCQIQNKVVKPGSITANYVCTGRMKGMGNLETTFPDPEHVKGSIHFVGSLDVNGHGQPIEWTTSSDAVFKSETCTNGAPAALQAPAKTSHPAVPSR